ncbi:MAG: 2-oxoglutarate and iron-dependent oxygenase domain-containing protein [Chitinophagales bacterium]|nr:isopenicillin N synthase family oxygenase [Chitinophagales bacterium]MDW8393878.1 2-oxoglutarate and iron-dependent oxygenase domain-containing protein [Chitinophagales bacterium]
MSYVPLIDLADFLSGHAEKKRRFVKELGDAYHDVGFVTVRNHGISERLIEDLYREVKSFFSLPLEIKLKYEKKELAGQRGYVSFGREHAKHSTVPDLKEFFQFGQTVTDGDPIKAEYPDNVWVEELPGFNEVMVNAYRSFEIAGNHLLRAIALYLELPENYFEKKVHNGNSILRAIHYPPITAEPGSALRAEQHEDINLITLLVGASAEGLEILTVEGNWVPVTALPGQIVVNVGDMLQRLTNNRLRSTTHRVVNPPRELWHTSRYSIPFFLHPRSDMRLDCLGSCISLENPRRYEPITAGEYLNERLVEIGLKPAKA